MGGAKLKYQVGPDRSIKHMAIKSMILKVTIAAIHAMATARRR
jgi:hypothetical protein